MPFASKTGDGKSEGLCFGISKHPCSSSTVQPLPPDPTAQGPCCPLALSLIYITFSGVIIFNRRSLCPPTVLAAGPSPARVSSDLIT